MRWTSKGAIAAVLVLGVTSCRSPFLGQSQSANQVEPSQANTSNQPTNRTRVQRANQPTRQARNNNQTTAQAPNATVNPEAPGTAQQGQSDADQAVPALW